MDAAIAAESVAQIGRKSFNFGVQHVLISSIFVKESLKLSSIIRKINDELRVLCSLHNFHFILNENITRTYLCGDGEYLTETGT